MSLLQWPVKPGGLPEKVSQGNRAGLVLLPHRESLRLNIAVHSLLATAQLAITDEAHLHCNVPRFLVQGWDKGVEG